MTGLRELCDDWLALVPVGAACAALVKAVKYRGFGLEAALGLDDLWVIALLTLGLTLPALAGPAGAVVGLVGGALLYLALWLDAVLFRVFTIELGPGGVGSVILSVLYRELAELAFARRFFAGHRLFAALPAAAALAFLGWLLAPGGSARLVVGLLVEAYLLLAVWVDVPPRARGRALAACGAFAGAMAVGALVPAARVPLAALGFGLLAAARGLAGVLGAGRASGPSGIRHFLFDRPRPDRKGFRPRPEHAPLVERAPRPPRPSAAHGVLRGRDVVLLTFESVGRAHLDAFAAGGARTPFLEGLLARSLRSRHHACVSPTTNNAHLALYASGYGGGAAFAGLRALREAGYRTVYLSAARTDDYGLRPLLASAGFDPVIDRSLLARGRVGPIPDQAILSEGLELLAEAQRGRSPLFVHVHATHTHVPYRVVEGERFRRFDPAEDYGRFLNGIEECDWIFGAFVEGLRRRGLVTEPLVVVSSDHGQAFGRLGYQSHGSAVTRDELDVPLVLHHPDLAPREVPFSSHFDVLPTILDLLGLTHGEPVFGDSLLHEDRRPELLVWAGHPSRSATSNYGVLLEGEKLMVDLVLDRCLRMDWSEERVEVLSGAEKEYAAALASRLMALRGVS